METTLLDVKIHYEQIGDRGPCVLFLHGWGCSIRHFEPIMQAMADGYRLYAIDFPAHGQSGRPPVPWGVDDFARLTEAFIQERGLAPCNIVAHSFGGRVAILLAATHPELVRRMVITGGAGIKKPDSGKRTAKQQLYRSLRGAVNLAERTHLFGDLPGRGREALVQRFGSPDYRALSPEMRKTFNRVISLDLTDQLEKIKAPTLLFWGAQDTETPLWMAKVMEEKIPDAGLVVEQGAGHFAYLERSATFLRVVRSFFGVDERPR